MRYYIDSNNWLGLLSLALHLLLLSVDLFNIEKQLEFVCTSSVSCYEVTSIKRHNCTTIIINGSTFTWTCPTERRLDSTTSMDCCCCFWINGKFAYVCIKGWAASYLFMLLLILILILIINVILMIKLIKTITWF